MGKLIPMSCNWPGNDPLMKKYHAEEWGTPIFDDQLLFEFLCLEGAQAGLSWKTILHRRENYRNAFDNFDFNKISEYGNEKREQLLANKGIIRNRLKIDAFITNAKVVKEIIKEFGSFSSYIWQFVDGSPTVNKYTQLRDIPANTETAEQMSKAMKKRGFKFVGPTICYAFMQATGMVNDHLTTCFRYEELKDVSK